MYPLVLKGQAGRGLCVRVHPGTRAPSASVLETEAEPPLPCAGRGCKTTLGGEVHGEGAATKSTCRGLRAQRLAHLRMDGASLGRVFRTIK